MTSFSSCRWTLALASTTFVGQNLGIDQVGRAKKGARTAFIMSVVATVILTIPLLGASSSRSSTAKQRSSHTVPCCCVIARRSTCFLPRQPGLLRRAARCRQFPRTDDYHVELVRRLPPDLPALMANFISNTIIPIALGYPAGWLVCSTLTLLYYRHADLSKSRLVEDAEKKAEASGKSRIKAV